PSVEHLAAARGSLRRLEIACERARAAAAEDESERARLRDAVLEEQARFDLELQAEQATPDYPGEREARANARLAIDALEGPVGKWLNSGQPLPQSFQLFDAVDRADDAIAFWLSVNAANGRAELERMKALRASTTFLALSLDSLCGLLAVIAGSVAVLALKRQQYAERAIELNLRERAGELELFANRVAHDLLNPLAVTSLMLSSIRRSGRDPSVLDRVVRAEAALERARHLVDGILDFARSGTKADGGSHLREVVDEIVEEILSDPATREVDMIVEPFDDLVVACSPGVLTSILSNLIGNAVKYVAGRDPQRVTLRTSPSESRVRVEVIDTGPGLPPGFAEAAFEPYVRGDETKPGLGLGLATVRRFVEAHGGSVGVDSVPDHGCLFWFELPRVSDAPQATSRGLT
ncbi:MAG TPA: HAMP domain-containing sensor histidine kinase, partial [Polyangiaceae bacterium]